MNATRTAGLSADMVVGREMIAKAVSAGTISPAAGAAASNTAISYVLQHLQRAHADRRISQRARYATQAADKAKNAVASASEKAYNKAVSEFKAAIASGEQKLQIIAGKQKEHILGDGYVQGKSYIYGSIADAQSLVNKYAGTGTFEKTGSGAFVKREIIMTDGTVGVAVNSAGEAEETRAFKIHYRKTGTHVVPKREV